MFSTSFGKYNDEKRKQLVYFDYQNVHAIIRSKACAGPVFLSSFSINLLAFYPEYRALIGYTTHYLFCDR